MLRQFPRDADPRRGRAQTGRSDAGARRSDGGARRSEAGGGFPGAGGDSPSAGFRRSDAAPSRSDARRGFCWAGAGFRGAALQTDTARRGRCDAEARARKAHREADEGGGEQGKAIRKCSVCRHFRRSAEGGPSDAETRARRARLGFLDADLGWGNGGVGAHRARSARGVRVARRVAESAGGCAPGARSFRAPRALGLLRATGPYGAMKIAMSWS